MEQFVILLIIAAISLINWLLQKSAEHKNRRIEQQKQDEGSGEVEFEEQPVRSDGGKWAAPEEDLRKFMEALGMPGEELPPPPIVQKHQPPPIPEVAPPEPVATAKTSAQIRSETNKEMRELAARFQKQAYDIADPEASGGSSPTEYREFFESPKKLRNAIILREILGPPKGLENL